MSQSTQTVLVTGASSGIGRATAELLAQRGFRVLAGVRDLAQAPQAEGIEPLALDVTNESHVERAIEQIGRTCPAGLFALVNNAGIGAPGAVELTELEEFRRLLEVNAVAPLRLIQRCLPALRQARGRIVNISSMNGVISLPMVGPYSASKFALEALSDALRVELRPWGVTVTLIRPGQVRTAIFDKAREQLQSRSQSLPHDVAEGYRALYERTMEFNERGAHSRNRPEDVARVVAKVLAAHRPKASYVVGFDAWGLQALRWLLPTRVLDALLARASAAGSVLSSPRVAEAPLPAKPALVNPVS